MYPLASSKRHYIHIGLSAAHRFYRSGATYSATAKLKDQRLSGCIAELIGWSDDDRAELETFCAIALEVMRTASSSKVREASRLVEIRCLMKDVK